MSDQHGPRGQRIRTESAADSAGREALQAEVATLYYVHQQTQEEIARRLGRSIATVSRLLRKAHANQVVEVQVRSPLQLATALQAELVKRFGLRVARVARVPASEPQRLAPQVSALAARYITTLLTDEMVICAASGTTTREVVNALPATQFRDIQVVQGIGSLGSLLPAVDNPLVTRLLAERTGGTAHLLPAPMIVDHPSVRDALAEDPHFRGALERCAQLDLALVGIGTVDPNLSIICRAGYLEPWEMERIRAEGAIGDILAEFYDLNGRFLETEVTSRVMGMRRDDLRNARNVVAVAGGASKVAAILGALRTGIIHVMVTDEVTARKVLELADVTSPSTRPASRQLAASADESAIHRDDEAPTRRVILDTTLMLLQRDGYRKLSIEAVATAAGVPHRTIARWWPSKADLVRDAFGSLSSEPATGNLEVRQSFKAILSPFMAREPGAEAGVSLACKTLIEDAQCIPELQRAYLDVHQSVRAALRAAIERARDRGELSYRAEPGTLADMLLGALWYRALMDHAPPNDAFVEAMIEGVIGADDGLAGET